MSLRTSVTIEIMNPSPHPKTRNWRIFHPFIIKYAIRSLKLKYALFVRVSEGGSLYPCSLPFFSLCSHVPAVFLYLFLITYRLNTCALLSIPPPPPNLKTTQKKHSICTTLTSKHSLASLMVPMYKFTLRCHFNDFVIYEAFLQRITYALNIYLPEVLKTGFPQVLKCPYGQNVFFRFLLSL